jgi:hypothetical protein
METEVNSLTFAYEMVYYKHVTSHGALGSEFTNRMKL